MIKRIFNSFGLTFFSSALFFLFNFYIAKLLGANEYGKINYYLSFIQIISLIISINYVSLYMGNKITKEDNQTFSLFFTIETLFFLIILYPTYKILSFYINVENIILLILLGAYLNVIITTISLEFNSQKKIEKSIFYGRLFPRVALIMLFFIFYFFNNDKATIYLYAFVIAYISLFAFFIYKWKPNFYIKKEIFKRAWKFYLLGIIGSSFQPIANILQKEFYGYKELATLSVALLILAGIYMFGSVLVKFVLPKIHEAWKNKNIKAIEKLYSNNTKLEIIIIGPIVMFILVYIDNFGQFLGEDYKLLSLYMYILMIGFLPDFFTGITGNLLRSTENEKYEIYNEIVRLIIGISFIYFFKSYSFGVVLALALSMFLYNVVKFLEVYYLLHIKPFNLKEFFGLTGYLVLLYSIFLGCEKLINNGIVISIIILFLNIILGLKYIKEKKLLQGFE